MWDRASRAWGLLNTAAIPRHCCARRRYSSALLATIRCPVRPVDDERGWRHLVQIRTLRAASVIGSLLRQWHDEVEIVENVDQWYGQDYCYFKIKGNDGNLYILRFDEGRAEWELTMFQSPGASATTSDGPDQSRTPRNEFHAGVRAAMIKISSGAPRGLSSHPRFGERRRH